MIAFAGIKLNFLATGIAGIEQIRGENRLIFADAIAIRAVIRLYVRIKRLLPKTMTPFQ